MVGNIGHSGMAFLISPLNAKIRQPSHDASRVSHVAYDYQELDTFGATSLRLSFTGWMMPPDTENTEVFLLESVVSVQDNGKWVADLDVLGIERDRPDSIEFPCDCPPDGQIDSFDLVYIDC